jgi:DNA-binding response OmpR family regulator
MRSFQHGCGRVLTAPSAALRGRQIRRYERNVMEETDTPQTDAPSSASSQCTKNRLPRILLVEDDGDIRRLNAEVLTHSGYHVHAAEDGAAAWETLQQNNYDLLVTDNEMPRMTGVELLKRLVAARIALPVIMATGALPQDEFIRRPFVEPDLTLLKPYTVEELLKTVKEVMWAINHAREQIATMPNRQCPTSTGGFQL